MDNIEKIVDFKKYCITCKHRKKRDYEGEEPCNECLNETVNIYSKKPKYYEEDETVNIKDKKNENNN